MSDLPPIPPSLGSKLAHVAFGSLVGVVALVHLDVDVSLAAMDSNNPSTLPNMAPQIRYLFIPILWAIVLVFAAISDAVMRMMLPETPLAGRAHLFSLGLSYSLLLAAFPLSRALSLPPSFVLAGPTLAICCAALVRWHARRSARARAI